MSDTNPDMEARQQALTLAVRLSNPRDIDTDTVVRIAEKFDRYLRRGEVIR